MNSKELSTSSHLSRVVTSECQERLAENSQRLPVIGQMTNPTLGSFSPTAIYSGPPADALNPNLLSAIQSLIGPAPSFPVARPLEQSQQLENLQSAIGPHLNSFQSSFPARPQVQVQGVAPTDPMAHLTQAVGLPVASAIIQQLFCSTLNAAAAPPQPATGSNFFTQLIAQLLATQLTQSAQVPSPFAGILQLLQAVSAISSASKPAMPTGSISNSSIMSQLPSLDPATAKEVIIVLVRQLIQSGEITNDEISRQFLDRLCFVSNKGLCQSTQAPFSWQNTQSDALSDCGLRTLTPTDVKKEVTSPDDEMYGGYSSSKSSHSDIRKLDLSTNIASQLQNTETNSEFSDAETNIETTKRSKKTQMRPSGKHLSTTVENKIKSGRNERSLFDQEFLASGKSLRTRSKRVKYNEDEGDGLSDDDDNDADYEQPTKKPKLPHSARKFLLLNERKEYKTSKDNASGKIDNEKSKDGWQKKVVSASLSKVPTETDSMPGLTPQKDSGNATQVMLDIKTELTDAVSILSNINCCSIPEVRYLFMGRKDEGMEWLNLVAYKSEGASASVNQCLFCPMTSSEVKAVADHISDEHSDLGFVLSNIKQINGRVTFLACRHCSYVTFELMLMWVHFEMYHSVPGIMDGSCLPQVKVTRPTNLKTISVDSVAKSVDSKVVYVCLDCMLCAIDGYKVAQHALDSHPNTTNFNGCFVKVMMIRTKENDSFSYRQALLDKRYSGALKDAYFCMLCNYTTSTAYLAMSHSLRMHQKKRLLFVCNDCEYQCLQESYLIAHMTKSHNFSGIASCICSVTLVIGSLDGCYSECEIPCNRKKSSNAEKSKRSAANFIQSTAISSSQKHKFFRVIDEGNGATDMSAPEGAQNTMPDLKPEIKTEDSSANHCSSEAPELLPIQH